MTEEKRVATNRKTVFVLNKYNDILKNTADTDFLNLLVV